MKKHLLLCAALAAATATANAQYVVMEDLPVPVALPATNISEYGYTANWQTVDDTQLDKYGYEPVGYYWRNYAAMTAKQDKQVFSILKTDFSDFTSTATIDNPATNVSESNPYVIENAGFDSRAGWRIQNPGYASGVLCLNGAYSLSQSNGALISPIADFSKGNGEVHFKFKLRGDGKTKNLVVWLRNNATMPNTVVDGKQLSVTTDWVEHELTLKGGVAEGDIMLMSYDMGTGENMYYFIDDLEIWQELNQGETATALYGDGFVIDAINETTAYIETGDLNPGEDFAYTISSYSYNGISPASNMIFLGKEGSGTEGIDATEATENTTAPVYDLTGRRMTAPTQPGIYIQGGKKFMVR